MTEGGAYVVGPHREISHLMRQFNVAEKDKQQSSLLRVSGGPPVFFELFRRSCRPPPVTEAKVRHVRTDMWSPGTPGFGYPACAQGAAASMMVNSALDGSAGHS